jgi:hypothetical protein
VLVNATGKVVLAFKSEQQFPSRQLQQQCCTALANNSAVMYKSVGKQVKGSPQPSKSAGKQMHPLCHAAVL